MGSLGRPRRRRGSLERRTHNLEEEAEFRERRRQLDAEEVLREALSRVSTADLEAMKEAFDRDGPEDWGEEDEPLMRRLLQLMNEVRNEEAGEFPWRREMDERKERRVGD